MSGFEIVLFVNDAVASTFHPKMEAYYRAIGNGTYEIYNYYKIQLALLAGTELRLRPATRDEIVAIRKGYVKHA